MNGNKNELKAPLFIIGGLIMIVFVIIAFIFLPNPFDSSVTKEPTETDVGTNGQADELRQSAESGIPVAASAIGDITITPVKTGTSRSADAELLAHASWQPIETDSEFIITTTDPISPELLSSSLTEKSGEPFNISALNNSDKEFLLTFNNRLEKNTIYKIEYTAKDKHPLSFAFQTVDAFRITSTVPANDSYSVPINSGIEITFSDEPVDNLEDYFSIEPITEGRFERVGRTVIFVPEALDYDTQYTVTIKSGIKNADGEVIEKDYKFSFNTEWNNSSEVYLSVANDVYETFLPDDEVFVELSMSGSLVKETYKVNIYDLITQENYISCYNGGEKTVSIPNDAKLLESMETDLFVGKDADTYYNDVYCLLGKSLPEGYYLIEIKTEYDNKEYSATKLIQVSALSVYSVSLGGETLFWVNDSTTGEPVSGAKISMDGNIAATEAGRSADAELLAHATGSDGTAIINTSENRDAIVRIEYQDHPVHIYRNQTYDPTELTLPEKYFSYIYTDREQYKTNDEIDIFGVINPKRGDFKLNSSDKVVLKLGDMLEIPLQLDAYGSFKEKIPVSNMYGYTSLDICINGERLNGKYVDFVDYPRDSYVFTVQMDRNAYFAGEDADAELSVTTYDGSPVEGAEIRSTYTSGHDLITKSDGSASTVISIGGNDSYNWQPYNTYLEFSLTGMEDYSQSVYKKVHVLPSTVMLEHEQMSEDTLEFTTSMINRDALESYIQDNEQYYGDMDVYRGEPVDTDITIEIIKVTTTREKTGDRYDFIQKIDIPKYEYRTEEESVDKHLISTNGGKALVEGLPVSDDAFVYYYSVVSFKDKNGREFSERINYGRSINYYDQSPIKDYYFRLIRKSADEGTWSYKLAMNETGQIKLDYYNSQNTDIQQGKIITILTGEKIINTEIGSPGGTPMTFTKECINNVTVHGAYFDGRYVFPVNYPLTVYYEADEREIDIDISFDKDAYSPGDEVTALIKATDQNKRALKSLINISVVDEAILHSDTPDFLTNYYESINMYGKPYFVYASYTQHALGYGYGSAAESGSGGDDYDIRKDFRDNPAFVSVETDVDGIASVKFSLADAVTSWRVTAHAITKDGYAGNTKANVIASLPYYIDMVMSEEFVVGDEISVLVKSFGKAYKLNRTKIDYKIEVIKDDEIIYTGAESSTASASFNAGKLLEGEYVVRVMASTDGYKDAMEKKISVVNDAIRLPLHSRQLVSDENKELSALDIVGSPVNITMMNGDLSFVLDVLYSCINYSSVRTDYKASTAFARDFMNGLFDNDMVSEQSNYVQELRESYRAYGGVPELPYASPDPFYTARFAACFPELLNKRELMVYILDNTGMYNNYSMDVKGSVSEEQPNAEAEAEALRAAGYLALAAAGDNVLAEIYEQLDTLQNNNDQTQFNNDYYGRLRVLYYAASLCVIGDDNGAYELMKKYEQGAEITGEKAEHINTLLLFINSTIDPPKAYEYLKTAKMNEYVSDVCERVNFLKRVVPKSGVRSEVQYVLNGETQTTKFENFDTLSLSLSKDQYDNLAMKQISGKTLVNISFFGTAGSLNRAYEKISIDKKIINEYNNINRITLDVKMPPDAPKGYYTVKDCIPSNMRFTKSMNTEGYPGYYVANPEKQLVDIGFYYKGVGGSVTVMYNAVRVSDAEAVIGPAYVSRDYSLDELWGGSK